jgi:hypothetical protein
MAAPDDGTPAGAQAALAELAATLREEDTLLAAHLREPDSEPALGALAAAGRRAEGAELDYAFVFEAVREGYLLHYGEPRIVSGADRDLALLAGDHLYAIGLECLAGLGDLEAVRELADLISLSAQLHAGPQPGRDRALGALWLGGAVAVAAGASGAHEAAKAALRDDGDAETVAAALAGAACATAQAGGIEAELDRAADSIDFDLPDLTAGG